MQNAFLRVQCDSTFGSRCDSIEHEDRPRDALGAETDAGEIEARWHAVRGLVAKIPRQLERSSGDVTREIADTPSGGVEDGHGQRAGRGQVNGGTHVGLPMTVSEFNSRRHIDGQIGHGGPTVQVETVNGGVAID